MLGAVGVQALRDRMLDAVHMADVDMVRELVTEMRSGVLTSSAPVSVTQVERVHGRNCLMHCGLDPQSEDVREIDIRCAAIAELLYEAGANVSHVDRHGWNAVAMGAVKGLARFCEVLIAHGADGDLPDDEGRTPLMKAINHGFLSVVIALLKKGASMSRADKDGWTPMHFAVRQAAGQGKFVAILDHLLAHSKRSPLLLNIKDNDGRTPLMYAAAQASLEIVDKLLLRGADPRLTDNEGRTAADATRSTEVDARLREWTVRLALEEHRRWLESTAQDFDDADEEDEEEDAGGADEGPQGTVRETAESAAKNGEF